MDEVDVAQAQELFARDEALFQTRKIRAYSATGYCLNCGDPVSSNVFCDLSCTQDFDRRKRLGRLAGHTALRDDPEINERFDSEPRTERGSSSEPGELDAQTSRGNF